MAECSLSRLLAVLSRKTVRVVVVYCMGVSKAINSPGLAQNAPTAPKPSFRRGRNSCIMTINCAGDPAFANQIDFVCRMNDKKCCIIENPGLKHVCSAD